MFILFSIVLLNSCKEATAPDYNNIYDPDSELFRGQSPSNFKITALSKNIIRLDWQNNSNYEDGYIIERSVNNDSEFVKIGEVGQNVTSFLDSSATENNLNAYYYRLRMLNINTNKTADIITGHYVEKTKLAENINGFCVSPDGEYIAIYKIEGASKGRVLVYYAIDGTEIFNFAYATDVFVVALGNDIIAIARHNENIRKLEIWSLIDGALVSSAILSIYSIRDISSMTINHQGNVLVFFNDDGVLNIWNLENGLSLTAQKEIYAEYSYLKFSKDDKYLLAIEKYLYNQYAVYNSSTWIKIFSDDFNGYPYIIPHIVNRDMLFYLDNSICFYDLSQKSIVSIINDLDYVINFGGQNRININYNGSVLSAFHPLNEEGINNIKIDFWSLSSDYKLFKKFRTIDFENEIPTDNVFSSKNDFIVKTNSGSLYIYRF